MLVGVRFIMLSFDITQSSPFSIKLWVTSGFTYLYLISLCSYFSFLETLPLKKLSISIDGWKIHFVIEKKQFCGEYFKYLYQNELEGGLLPTPQEVTRVFDRDFE